MLIPVTDINRLIADLEARLDCCLRERRVRDHQGALSVTLAVPELGELRPRGPSDTGIYWGRPASREWAIGGAPAVALDARGEDRFGELDARFDALCASWLCLDPERTGFRPRANFALPFAPAQAGIEVPAVLYQRRGGSPALTFSRAPAALQHPGDALSRWSQELSRLLGDSPPTTNAYPAPDPLDRIESSPSDAQWMQRVDLALQAIDEGLIDKVVVTRRVRVRRRRPISTAAVLDWLERHRPGGVHFSLGGAEGTLIGVSPEGLATVHDGVVASDAVAGTAPRDRDPVADGQLGEALRGSAKIRREHQLVIDDLVQALGPLCTGLSFPAAPTLMKLPGLQHLWTPIRGRTRPGTSLIRIASRLHPTAAVGGAPRRGALAWLAEHEPEPRGWYTGALGWLDRDGGGELSVILRCALIRGNTADLFAGSGIVTGSDPEAELLETEWKLRTMLDALGAA